MIGTVFLAAKTTSSPFDNAARSISGNLRLGKLPTPGKPALRSTEETASDDRDGAFIDEDAVGKVKKVRKDATEDDSEEVVAEPYVPFVPTDDEMFQLKNSVGFYLTIFVMGVFLYYGISLGVVAQTYGMWFWGIIIVKGYDNECLPARAFLFTVAMFAIGIVTPLVVLLNPQGRSLHGYLTGTRLIRVAAKPKA